LATAERIAARSTTAGTPGEILHHYARRQKWNAGAVAFGGPCGDVPDIVLRDLFVVALAKSSFQHDADRKRQPLELSQTRFFERVQFEDDV